MRATITETTVQAVRDTHANRSAESWANIRAALRRGYRRRTGSIPSADTLQELLIAFLLRAKSDRDLQEDRFRVTIWRTIGDVIVDKVQADANRRSEQDAAEIYGALKSERHTDPDGIRRNSLIPTHTKTRAQNGRNEVEQSALSRIRAQLQREAAGEIEIYRPALSDVRFA